MTSNPVGVAIDLPVVTLKFKGLASVPSLAFTDQLFDVH